MTIFNLEQTGRWFEIDGGGRVQIRNMTAEKHKEIRKKAIKKKTIFKKVEGTPAKFEDEIVDDDLINDLFWDFVIVDWENFQDANGNVIECNTENKLLLISKSAKFAKIVTDAIKVVAEEDEEEQAVLEKN